MILIQVGHFFLNPFKILLTSSFSALNALQESSVKINKLINTFIPPRGVESVDLSEGNSPQISKHPSCTAIFTVAREITAVNDIESISKLRQLCEEFVMHSFFASGCQQ